MTTYLKPLITTLQKLHMQGIDVITKSGTIRVFGHLLVATLDLPAKAMVACMKQFNGKSACSVCLDEGVPRPNLPMLRYYPFTDDNEMRTHVSWLDDANGTVHNDAVRGIKGTSPLATLSYVDLPKVFAVDWMHCVLLGVVKALMKYWFNGPRGSEYYIGDKVAFLNKKFQAIKVPDFVARTPRTLTDHSHWKASECREWLFHFSIPLLSSVMKPLYLCHYSLLVTAMVILNLEEIKPEQLDFANKMMRDFCKIFPEIYGAVHQTMNVHLLRHLPHFVKLHGPLFTTSCFGFESMNSHLKSMVHGTRHVTQQVTFAVNMAKSLPTLVQSLTKDGNVDPTVQDFLHSLSMQLVRVQDDVTAITVLGKKKEYVPDDAFIDTFKLKKETKFCKFFRALSAKGIFFSRQYDRVKCRNSYTVAYEQQGVTLYGVVEYFVEADVELFAVIKEMRPLNCSVIKFDDNCKQHSILSSYTQNMSSLCGHIVSVVTNDTMHLVPISDLRTKCVFIPISPDGAYLSVPPNLVEHS